MRTRRTTSSSNSTPAPEDGRRLPYPREGHVSVLLQEAVEMLAIQPESVVVDATLGGAGHTAAIAAKLSKKGLLIGIDADSKAIERARARVQNCAPRVCFAHGNFRDITNLVRSCTDKLVDGMLFDLGWSGFQLQAGRGFSLSENGPLLMTYADTGDTSLTAHTIVNTWGEESLYQVIRGWGEERYARRIARGLLEARNHAPIETAHDLQAIIARSVPPAYRYGRIHPATRTFQALRIAVNDELGALHAALQSAPEISGHGTRVAIISFHSLEDRIVKHTFQAWAKEGKGNVLTKKPITASPKEIAHNPRSRSAKLRVFQFN